MSDLNFSKETISNIFTKLKGKNFLIPDYQRPYSWKLEHCETLWDDLKNFAIPDFSEREFNKDKDEYFLGTIVTFDNGCEQNEVIDGQQRLITLILLLRAFYSALNDGKKKIKDKIAECIWYMDEDDNPDKSRLKIESEVATDEHTAELKRIIMEGQTAKGDTSLYAQNYRFFQKKIDEFKIEDPDNFSYLPTRLLNNCIVMPIETSDFSTALRIFTTLNDRGMPLSDSDIFKSQFYKFFKSQGKDAKEKFVRSWKNLEAVCNKIFHPRTGTSTDDLFMKYTYYLRANEGTKSDTFQALRLYYEKDNYKILKSAQTFNDLINLLKFWYDIFRRNEEKFSERILKRLYVLKYSPYSIWENIVSMYFMGNRDSQNNLDEEKFYNFLNQITALVLMQAITQPGVQSIRRPFFVEFQNILHGERLKFKDCKTNEKILRTQFSNMKFSQTKTITRAMLVWWLFQNENQALPPLDTYLEIEHIYAKKRAEFEPLENAGSLELLGNKILLEKRINIRAADYRFADKKKYYCGETNKKNELPTFNLELLKLAETKNDFEESDILERNEQIFNGFVNYLQQNDLLK